MQSETPPCPEPQRSEQEWTEVAKALRTHAKELFSTRTNASTFRNNLLRAADLLDAHNAALALAWKEHDEHEAEQFRKGWDAGHKAGAEVCKPLVDALEAQAKLTAYYNGKSDGHWRNYLCPKALKALTDFNARKSEGVKTK